MIIEGFAVKGGEFCLTEALQVVCIVDDGPKTDWRVVCMHLACVLLMLVQVGTIFK